MTTYPLASLAPVVASTGITAPSYDDAYLSLVATFQTIYGSDIVLTSDTQDGQLVGIFAQAISDCNAAAIAVRNGFAPGSAQGNYLSSLVKINGLTREVPSNSTCPVTVTGTVGTIITNGMVGDTLNKAWALPATVTIPTSGSIVVTATCAVAGSTQAAIGSITKILTPTLGWLTVANASAATAGNPVESDAQLRGRQAVSTAISAVSPVDAIIAAVRNLPGVTRINWDENATGTTDGNGVPGHSIAIVVEGGSATAIAQTIAQKKTVGSGTYGSINETIVDAYGIPASINFSAPTYERIVVNLSIHALTGYTVQIGNNIVAALQSYVAGLEIGESVYLTQMIAAAIQGSGGLGAFNLTALTQGIYPATPSAADVAIAYNQVAALALIDITLSLV